MDAVGFLNWWIETFAAVVDFLINYWTLFNSDGLELTLGRFAIVCVVLSIIIGVTVTQIRGASLTHEAGVYNRRLLARERQQRQSLKGGGKHG